MNEIMLYGFGGLGKKFYHYIENKNFKVISILDKGKSGQSYNEVEIVDPKSIRIKNISVIITILNEYVNIYEVKEYLIKLGFEKVYTIFESIEKFDLYDFEHLFLRHPNSIQKDLKNIDIDKVRNLLSDELSKNIFNAIMNFRKTFRYELINDFYDRNMYLPDVILEEVKNKETMNVLDLGACHGDLIDVFNGKNIKIDNYYAFEPDSANLIKLQNKIYANNLDACVFPMGAGDFDGLIGFNSGSGTGCNIDENSEHKIMVSKVDSTIMAKVDFVKMDIEGFENQALEGMKKLILKNKPILAISIYHLPLDFINIPLSLSRKNIKDYSLGCTEDLDLILSCMQYDNFYIRYHGHYGFEFVLYIF